MKYLSISNDIKLPIDAATQTTAIVARKRVGKTYTASVQAEEFIKADIPIVVLDPTGAWWGLRSSADGKKDGYPVVIIGGSHADVPLEETAGKVIADLVVDKPGFYIIDFSQIETDAAIHRFATDFAKRFYFRKEEHRFPIVLFVDEADVFIPQNPFGEEKRMLHSFDVIVRRGGIRGIGVVLITQRPAVLHKNVLTQCETLITLQISGSQDIDALQHWTRVHGTKEQREEYYSTVSSLEIGEAWIWSPSWLRVFKRIRIRRRETFNSSATPKVGEKAIVPKRLAPVDLENLSKSIKETIQKAKENDPDALRKKVIELQSLVKKLESQKPKAELSDNEKQKIVAQIRKEYQSRIAGVERTIRQLEAQNKTFLETISRSVEAQSKVVYPTLSEILIMPLPVVKINKDYSKTVPVLIESQGKFPIHRDSITPTILDTDENLHLGACERAILGYLVSNGHRAWTKEQIGIMTGYSPNSGGFNNALSKLGSSQWIFRDKGMIQWGGIRVPEGINTDQEFSINNIRRKIGKCENEILDVLLSSADKSFSKEELASLTASQYSAGSGGFNNSLSKLGTLGLIKRMNGNISLSDNAKELL